MIQTSTFFGGAATTIGVGSFTLALEPEHNNMGIRKYQFFTLGVLLFLAMMNFAFTIRYCWHCMFMINTQSSHPHITRMRKILFPSAKHPISLSGDRYNELEEGTLEDHIVKILSAEHPPEYIILDKLKLENLPKAIILLQKALMHFSVRNFQESSISDFS